jgi:hypothetical protein
MKYILALLLLATPVFADPICITDDDDYDRLYRLNSINADKINALERDMVEVKSRLGGVTPKPVDNTPPRQWRAPDPRYMGTPIYPAKPTGSEPPSIHHD